MPMTWDAAADAKLFTCIMQVYEVKITGSKLEDVAKLMGDDCTAKAITHRLAKIRAGSGVATPSSTRGRRTTNGQNTPTATPSKSTTKTARGKGSDKTPASTNTKGKGKTGGTQATILPDDNEDDAEELDVQGGKGGAKDVKRKLEFGDIEDEEEEEEEGWGKKVKKEDVEDDGDDEVVI